MNKKMLLYFVIIFIFITNVFSEEDLDYYKVDKKYYSLKEYDKKYDEDLTWFQSDYYTVFFGIFKGRNPINGIEKYFSKINNNTLEGINVRDSILLHVRERFNSDMVPILKNYLNQKPTNQDVIKNMIQKKQNENNYVYSSFSYSTMVYRKSLEYNVSLLLPNSDWKMQKLNTSSGVHYLAGDNSYSGSISLNVRKISKTYNIYEDNKINYARFNFKSNTKNRKKDLYQIKGGEIIEIGSNIKIGNKLFKKNYEQITCSSEKYNFQVYVARRRFYVTDTKIYIIELTSIIAGNHILANRDKLILQKGLLLDSIRFE